MSYAILEKEIKTLPEVLQKNIEDYAISVIDSWYVVPFVNDKTIKYKKDKALEIKIFGTRPLLESGGNRHLESGRINQF